MAGLGGVSHLGGSFGSALFDLFGSSEGLWLVVSSNLSVREWEGGWSVLGMFWRRMMFSSCVLEVASRAGFLGFLSSCVELSHLLWYSSLVLHGLCAFVLPR